MVNHAINLKDYEGMDKMVEYVYRIAVGYNHDNKWTFDHYATREEMQTLRHGPFGNIECLFDKWEDMSETHKLEIGIAFMGKPVYINDVVLQHYDGGIDAFIVDDIITLLNIINGSIHQDEELNVVVIGNIYNDRKFYEEVLLNGSI